VKVRRLQWAAPQDLAGSVREWFAAAREPVDVSGIEAEVAAGGDQALLDLTRRFDAPEARDLRLVVSLDQAAALRQVGPEVVRALEIAISNVGQVAQAQLNGQQRVELPQGQVITVGEAPVAAAGIYAPGGRASYPSSVIMGCVTARVAEVDRVVLATPPGPDGRVNPVTLAAASLCEVDEIFAIGGAQAIFALARGTETVQPVDVIAGPGNAWVQAAKKAVFGEVAIDSPAGPSDLTVVFDRETDLDLVALDLCAQAEHGAESPLTAVAVNGGGLDSLEARVKELGADQPSVMRAVPRWHPESGLRAAYSPVRRQQPPSVTTSPARTTSFPPTARAKVSARFRPLPSGAARRG